MVRHSMFWASVRTRYGGAPRFYSARNSSKGVKKNQVLLSLI